MWCDGCNPDNCSGCWDPDVERHTVRWIERHCVHTKAKWIGRPFKLLPAAKRPKGVVGYRGLDTARGRRRR